MLQDIQGQMENPRVSVVAPVLNEADFIGYSIMSCADNIHEFVYALDEKSDDGTRDLLYDLKANDLYEKLVILETPNFHPSDMKAYNAAFNACIEKATGDAVFFYHPDMLITEWPERLPEAQAWWTNVTSYAGDFQTVITKGRCDKWKNIHMKNFGLEYWGGYGSVNEDFYHADITGNAHYHYGTDFSKYPYAVRDSGIKLNHYCELKPYKRRYEKMKLCLKTQHPTAKDDAIEEVATNHPRVSLEAGPERYGVFEFTKTDQPVPDVITKYRDRFESYTKGGIVCQPLTL